MTRNNDLRPGHLPRPLNYLNFFLICSNFITPLAPLSGKRSNKGRNPRCFSGERERGFSQKSRLSHPDALLFGGYVVQ